jgi:zinc transport system ATP-binding protein
MTEPDAGPPLVEIDGLTVRRDGATLLENVSLRVRAGTIHMLTGPNGAGKTTLLRAVLGQIPFAGTIRCHWRREGRIGYVPQQLDLDRELPMTAEDFLAMMWQRRPVCLGMGAPARGRVAAALEAAGLGAAARRRVGALSGGELQRLLLAQAIAGEPSPELLLLDEPTAGVDAAGLQAVEDALLRLKRERGVTALMVSHDAAQARRLGGWMTRLHKTVIHSGPPETPD